MAALTGYFANSYVLRVVEVNVVGQVMNFNPLNRLSQYITLLIAIVILFLRVPSCIFVQFMVFCCIVHFFTLVCVKLLACVFVYLLVAVHTYISRWHHCLLAFFRTCVAV